MSYFDLDLKSLLAEKEQQDNYDFMSVYNKRFVDLSEEMPKPIPLISIGNRVYMDKVIDTHVMTIGEMSAIVAPSKSMKSVLSSCLAACFIGGKYISEKFPSFKSHRGEHPDFEGEQSTIIHIDTEQGNYHAQKTFRRAKDISNPEYPNYKTFAMRSESAETRVRFIDDLLKNQEALFDAPIRLIIVDGIADLVDNTNDIVLSKQVSDYVMRWTDTYKLHILCVIHKNHDSNKPTGHLGSYVVKKAETVFLLGRVDVNNKRSDIQVTCEYSRDYPFEPFTFNLDEHGKPYQADAIEIYNEPIKYEGFSIIDESTNINPAYNREPEVIKPKTLAQLSAFDKDDCPF